MFDVFDSASVQAIARLATYIAYPTDYPITIAHYRRVLRYIGERMLRTLANTYHDLPPALR